MDTQKVRIELDNEAYCDVVLALYKSLVRLDRKEEAEKLYEEFTNDQTLSSDLHTKLIEAKSRWRRGTHMWVDGYGWMAADRPREKL